MLALRIRGAADILCHMKKIFGLVKMSPLQILTAEYIGIGVVVSVFSAFLGFYCAAFVVADKCYPELAVETIQIVHRQLFHNMALAAGGYSLVVFSLYWFFARGQIKHILRIARQAERES